MSKTVTERFAPSPTGELHLGHAFSAMVAHDAARAADGRFLVRFEDLDSGRVRDEFYEKITEDLNWLGLSWDERPLRQSDRLAAYQKALDDLSSLGVLYGCDCTRRDISEAISAPQEDRASGLPDFQLYPGTCRQKSVAVGPGVALRLDMIAALAHIKDGPLARCSFFELDQGLDGESGHQTLSESKLVQTVGDVVLRRKDGSPAYHLSVVVDDHFQGVTTVTRGRDLYTATPVHRLLQALLKLNTPTYRHHRLIRDKDGKRLAKRDQALSITQLRKDHWSPERIRTELGLSVLA